MIKKYFKKSDYFLPNREIMAHLRKHGFKKSMQYAGRMLAEYGYEQGIINNKRGWFVKLVDGPMLEGDEKYVMKPGRLVYIKLPELGVNSKNAHSVNKKLRRLLSTVDSYFMHLKTGISQEKCYNFKNGSYDLNQSEIEIFLNKFEKK